MGWNKGRRGVWVMPSFQDVENAGKDFLDMRHQHWLQHNVFTWQWWFLFCLTIVPWFLWWRLVDKKQLVQMFLYGTLIVIITTTLDIIGTNLRFWAYPQQLFWFLIPPLLPVDSTLMPVEHMLVYQYFRRWRNFVIALCIVAVFNALVAEPLFTKSGMYELYSWKYAYSIPIYVLKAISTRWFVEKLLSRQTA